MVKFILNEDGTFEIETNTDVMYVETGLNKEGIEEVTGIEITDKDTNKCEIWRTEDGWKEWA